MPLPEARTHVYLPGLWLAMQLLEQDGRNNAPDLIVVLTDGLSTIDGHLTCNYSSEARSVATSVQFSHQPGSPLMMSTCGQHSTEALMFGAAISTHSALMASTNPGYSLLLIRKRNQHIQSVHTVNTHHQKSQSSIEVRAQGHAHSQKVHAVSTCGQ